MTARELAELRDRVARARIEQATVAPVCEAPTPPPATKRKPKPGPIRRDRFVVWLEKFDAARAAEGTA